MFGQNIRQWASMYRLWKADDLYATSCWNGGGETSMCCERTCRDLRRNATAAPADLRLSAAYVIRTTGDTYHA